MKPYASKARSSTSLAAIGSCMLLLLSACASSADQPATPSPASSSSARSSVSSVAVSSARSSSSAAPVASASSKAAFDGVLGVPFAPQAPFAVWDPLHEEACEEMSMIMVTHFYKGESLSLDQAEKEVQDLIAWERAHGYGDDVGVDEMQVIVKQYYGLDTRVIEDVTEEKLREALANGTPIIIPAAGRDLKNPYFSGEGPWYHMLVVTGFDDGVFSSSFITNDPGTKRGEKYAYPASTLVDAIHDWTGVKEEIRTGAKRALVIVKPG